jgi:recombination protein RecT
MANLKVFNQTITRVETQEYLQQVLGEKKGEFISNVIAVVANNKALQECDPMTTMYAALKVTALGLPLDQNLGFAYIIPYKDNKNDRVVAQLQFGYKSIVQLAIRSGQFQRINVTDVREGELVGRNRRTGEIKINFIEDDAEREKLPIIGYLGYFRLLNGYEKESYWTVEELKKHGLRYSQTYGSKNQYVKENSKWATDFDAMAKKTVLKLMLNKGDAPMSVQIEKAIKFDQAVIKSQNDDIEYVDNQPERQYEDVEAQAIPSEEQAQVASELFKD